MELDECAECGQICDAIETDPPEAPEDRMCCRCSNMVYDESCVKCGLRLIERMSDVVNK